MDRTSQPPNKPTAQPLGQAVACLSGGLDSTASMAMAISAGWQVVRAITFGYGQRAEAREKIAAGNITAHYKVPHQVIDLPWFQSFSMGGGLIQKQHALPNPGVRQLSDSSYSKQSAKAVWVPNRNGVMLEIAAGIAEDLGATAVLVGFNREEAETFPDNSKAYVESITQALSFSTANKVKILSPTVLFDKVEIVNEAKRLGVPLNLLWSCYEGDAQMCGVCESCMRLKRALAAHGVLSHAPFENARF